MKKQQLSILLGIMIILIGGIVFVWQKSNQTLPQNQTKEEKIVEIPDIDNLDTSDWKTYRNEEYGFEIKYPKTWITEEFFTAGLGISIDCQKTSKECKNFSLKLSPTDMNGWRKNPVVFENFNNEKASIKGIKGISSWEKVISGVEFSKSSSYFPLFASCYVQAIIPNVSLKKSSGFYIYTLYELPGDMYVDELEKSCSQEIPDKIFDEIVGSFSALK